MKKLVLLLTVAFMMVTENTKANNFFAELHRYANPGAYKRASTGSMSEDEIRQAGKALVNQNLSAMRSYWNIDIPNQEPSHVAASILEDFRIHVANTSGMDAPSNEILAKIFSSLQFRPAGATINTAGMKKGTLAMTYFTRATIPGERIGYVQIGDKVIDVISDRCLNPSGNLVEKVTTETTVTEEFDHTTEEKVVPKSDFKYANNPQQPIVIVTGQAQAQNTGGNSTSDLMKQMMEYRMMEKMMRDDQVQVQSSNKPNWADIGNLILNGADLAFDISTHSKVNQLLNRPGGYQQRQPRRQVYSNTWSPWYGTGYVQSGGFQGGSGHFQNGSSWNGYAQSSGLGGGSSWSGSGSSSGGWGNGW